MKKLDLNAIGVEELNHHESLNVNGGSINVVSSVSQPTATVDGRSFWGYIGAALCILGVCTGNLLAVGAGAAMGGWIAIAGDEY